jgi:hypothetical protein
MTRLHETIVKELASYLRSELTGRDKGDLLYYPRPYRQYPVGYLTPEKQTEQDTIYPSSCGFAIKLSGHKGMKVQIKIKGHYYVRRKTSLKEQLQYLSRTWQLPENEIKERLKKNPLITIPYCWSNIPFQKELVIEYNQPHTVNNISDCLISGWYNNKIETVNFREQKKSRFNLTEDEGKNWTDDKDYDNWLKEKFPNNLPDPETGKTHNMELESEWIEDTLRIHIINRSKRPDPKDKIWYLIDQNIYSITIECIIPEGSALNLTNKKITDTFNADAFVESWGEGRNLQLRFINNRTIYAEPFGLIECYRTKPLQSLGSTDLSFKTLSQDPLPTAKIILDYLKSYQKKYDEANKKFQSLQSESSLKRITDIVNRVENGFKLLQTDPDILEAFKLMNETFARRYISEKNINSWRGFQFVYLLGKLPHIIKNDLDSFDVIFVPTGGGKTETYFGFLITALFYLRFKKITIGTVAIVKFPLRMLALDQIQRIAPLIAIADMVRQENKKISTPKNEPNWLHEFSLGFMIGGTSSRTTPNRVHGSKMIKHNNQNEDEVDLPDENTDLYQILTESPEELKVLFECPICKYNDFQKGITDKKSYDTINISYDDLEIRAKHKCECCGFRFAIHWTDEECFRYLPSIIVSTQDRVAYPAFTPYVRGILGAPLFYCPDHGFSIYIDRCTPFKGGYGKLNRECKFLKNNKTLHSINIESKDRALRYIIQDEMHLLQSDLGALDSPFEKMTSFTVEHYTQRPIQYIGMSATVQGVQKQVKEIYGSKKTVWLFPGDPPCDNFAKPPQNDAFFEYTSDLHRLYVGCSPVTSDPSTVVSKSIEIMTRLIFSWEKLVRDEKLTSLPPAFHSFSKDVISEGLRLYRVNLGFMRTKIDLERTKQNLININNVERQNAIKRGEDITPELIVEELTGDNSIKDIRDTITKIKNTAKPESEDTLDVLLATNLVSHGIDLKEMNLMTFFGIPGSTAEYIQAMSRVGRSFPGIILIVFHPNRARDRGLWRTYTPYHIALRQQVETMPVDHFAPGILDQALITLFRSYCNLIAEVDIFGSNQGLYTLGQIVTQWKKNGDSLIKPATDILLNWLEWDKEHEFDINSKLEEYLCALEKYHDIVKKKAFPLNLKLFQPAPYSHYELYKGIGIYAEDWMSTMTGIRGIQPDIPMITDRFSNIYLNKGGG